LERREMIRKATKDDFHSILELYRKGLEELGETNIVESMLLKKVVNSYQLAPCFLLVINDNIAGMAGFTTATTSHNGVASLVDYMFYVEPEHRNIKNLGDLVQSAKEFAIEHALPIRLEFVTNNDEETRKRLFKLHGFEPSAVVGFYNKEVA
jgi:hypothetical protein